MRATTVVRARFICRAKCAVEARVGLQQAQQLAVRFIQSIFHTLSIQILPCTYANAALNTNPKNSLPPPAAMHCAERLLLLLASAKRVERTSATPDSQYCQLTQPDSELVFSDGKYVYICFNQARYINISALACACDHGKGALRYVRVTRPKPGSCCGRAVKLVHKDPSALTE
jgi:hypothetical protein